jgi:FMN phosphatase YigB (HAD superfamily)
MAPAFLGNCVCVDDTISRDVLGARRAGYQLAIRIEHAPLNGLGSQETAPDFVINDMNELLRVLESDIK